MVSQHVSKQQGQADGVPGTLHTTLRNLFYLLCSTMFTFLKGWTLRDVISPHLWHLASQSPALSDILISVIKPLAISSFVFMGMIKWQLFSSRPPCRANCWLGSKHAANWADLVCERLMLLAKSHKQKMCWSSLLCSSDFRQFLVPGGKQGRTVFSKPWVTCPRWLGLWYPYHTKVK